MVEKVIGPLGSIGETIGWGPAITIFGLVLDGVGVILSLWPYVFQTDKEIASEAEAILTSEWSDDRSESEWLNTSVGKTRLQQRKSAQFGLLCLACGFFLQAIGTYIWASS